MRLLYDHNVTAKYVQAFEQADGIAVTTVVDELTSVATDEEIVESAKQNDWVVFTTDDDFFEHADVCGVLVYRQITDPSPGDVLDAVDAIDNAYESHSEILETVPRDWTSSM